MAPDVQKIMAYASPPPKEPLIPRLIIFVTGEHGVGKKYCVECFIYILEKCFYTMQLTTHSVRAQPHPDEDQLSDCIEDAAANGVDVLFIIGIEDEASVATFSRLVPEIKVIEVHVHASKKTMQKRGYDLQGTTQGDLPDTTPTPLNHVLDFIFDNDTDGVAQPQNLALDKLAPLLDRWDGLRRLERMIPSIPDFPCKGVEGRHVLGITNQPEGLSISTDFFKLYYGGGSWDDVDAIVSCEAGGFPFASVLAGSFPSAPVLGARLTKQSKPLVVVRKAGKLPPPTVSVVKGHSGSSGGDGEERLEIERDVIASLNPGGATVLVVDDVLSTGKTLCAVLTLLRKVGVEARRISVMVVAEYPLNLGRQLLREEGFGQVRVQSLLPMKMFKSIQVGLTETPPGETP